MVFGPIDWLVFVGYFILVLGVGFWAGRHERDTKDFFLGGRRQHWLLAGISIIATEVSALTIVGVPADAYRGDWNYLQLYAGAFVGRWLIVFLLLPAFYGGSVTTVYQYLGQRFGRRTQTTASLCFMSSRLVGSGIRLLAASIAVAEVFHWRLDVVVLGTLVLCTAYTMHGGIKAILWTDLLQASTFVIGGLAALLFLFNKVPGAWPENVQAAWDAGKLHTFTWKPSEGVPAEKLFWLLLVSSTLTNMAALGTDQDLTQRMLTCKDVRQSQRSLIFNLFAGFPIVVLFLAIGTMLYLYYTGGAVPQPPADLKPDRIFPYFIAHALPHNVGLRGLLVTAILAASMSSLASAIGALSSSAVTDIYRPWFGAKASEQHHLHVARVSTFLFGAALAAVALIFNLTSKALLWEALQWVGMVFGAMLGVFLLGVLTKTRGSDRFNLWIMLSSVAVLLWIRCGQFLRTQDTAALPDNPSVWRDIFFPPMMDHVVWPWWIIIGTTWTFALGACFQPSRARKEAGLLEPRSSEPRP